MRNDPKNTGFCVPLIDVNSQFHIASTIFYCERFRSTGRSGWTIFGCCVVLCVCVCVCVCAFVCVDHAEDMGHDVGGIISNSLSV